MKRIQVKWGGKTLNFDVNPSEVSSGVGLKRFLEKETNVPASRQKLLSPKVWRGILKDEDNIAIEEGAVITLMGSAAAVADSSVAVKFVEDLSKSEATKLGSVLPAGLVNVGNTCYLNSVVQSIRGIPELREAIGKYKTVARTRNESTEYKGVNVALADLLDQLDNSGDSVNPIPFFSNVVKLYPKFGEMSSGGTPKQQDAEEFLGVILNALAHELDFPTQSVMELTKLEDSSVKPNVIDSLMGITMEVSTTCMESEDEPKSVKIEGHRKLVCNIQGGHGESVKVDFLHEGIALGMKGEIEKRSDILGRNAKWSQELKIAKLPKIIPVQLMRFFWKKGDQNATSVEAQAGNACKILKPVAFPLKDFDILPFVNTELKEFILENRKKLEEEEEAAIAAKLKGEEVPNNTASGAPIDEDDDPELAAAIRASLQDPNSPTGKLLGQGVPQDFAGYYELCAVVSHKGRSSDSGHYISFVKKKNPKSDDDSWIVFDDDHVEETSADYVATRLKGGGDDMMAFLLFYRASDKSPKA